jgi:hypothetical protein
MDHLKSLRAGLLLAPFALPAAAMAAPPAPMPAVAQPAAPATAAMTPSDQSPQPLPAAMQAKLDQHIKDLHDQLAITPAEQPQWDAFANVMRDNAEAMHRALESRGTGMGQMDALQNMQSYAELARVHADNMQKLSTSFASLYASLSSDQKQVADAVFRNDHARHEAARKHTG